MRLTREEFGLIQMKPATQVGIALTLIGLFLIIITVELVIKTVTLVDFSFWNILTYGLVFSISFLVSITIFIIGLIISAIKLLQWVIQN
jgi:hypothetical protein